MNQTKIKRASEKVRKDFLSYLTEHSAALYAILESSANRIDRIVINHSQDGIVKTETLPILQETVNNTMLHVRPAAGRYIVASMKKSADFGLIAGIVSLAAISEKNIDIGTSFINADGKIIRFDAAKQTFADSKWAAWQTDIVDELLVYKKTGIGVSDTIYDITRQAEKTLNANIGTAVLIGTGLKEINDITRKALIGENRSVLTQLETFETVKAQAAFNAGITKYAEERGVVVGFISRVHTNNPEPYDKSIDGLYFPKGLEPDPPYHFGCQCTLEPVVDEPPVELWADEDQRRGYDFWMAKHAA